MRSWYKKVISIVVTVTFLSNSATVYSLPIRAEVYRGGPISLTNSWNGHAPKSLHIPSYYGEVSRVYGDSPEVILIGDAHCNYDAQRNVSGILKVLVNEYGVKFIGVEGAKDLVDLRGFDRVKDRGKKERVIDEFVRRGYVTGAEFMRIVEGNDIGVELYGVEEVGLYRANYDSMRKCLDRWGEWEGVMERVKGAVEELKEAVWSEEVLGYDKLVKGYRDGKTGMSKFVGEVWKEYKGYIIDIDRYPDVERLLRCIEFEGGIDFEVVEKERDNLVKRIMDRMVREDVEGLVRKSLEYKLGRISGVEYYRYLGRYTDFSDTPNLHRYVRLLEVYECIDKERLVREVDGMIEDVYYGLVGDGEGGELVGISKDVGILDKAVHLRLGRSEYEYFREGFDRGVVKRVKDMYEEYTGNKLDIPDRVGLEEVDEFYQYAVERDE